MPEREPVEVRRARAELAKRFVEHLIEERRAQAALRIQQRKQPGDLSDWLKHNEYAAGRRS